MIEIFKSKFPLGSLWNIDFYSRFCLFRKDQQVKLEQLGDK
jgi:hypothetical protein